MFSVLEDLEDAMSFSEMYSQNQDQVFLDVQGNLAPKETSLLQGLGQDFICTHILRMARLEPQS